MTANRDLAAAAAAVAGRAPVASTRRKAYREILEDAAADRQLGDALPSTLDGGKYTSRSLGKLMTGHEGKWYGSRPKMTLRRKQDHHQVSWWQVEELAD